MSLFSLNPSLSRLVSKFAFFISGIRKKNKCCYGSKIRDNTFFFVAETKNFAAATKRFVDRTKHFVVVKKYFCYHYFNKRFCCYNKTFYTVYSVVV